MLPAKQGDMGKQLIWHIDTFGAQM